MWCQVLYQKTVHNAYRAYTGRDSWFTFVEHACSNYQCLPVVSARLLQPHYNVTTHTETTRNWNLQYKKVLEDQHEAVPPSSLVWQKCQHVARSLSHLLVHTSNHIDRRDTRSQPAAKLCAREKRSVLDLLRGHGHDRSAQQHAGGSRSERSTQGERERAKASKTRRRPRRSSRISWRNRSSITRSKSGSCKRASFASYSSPTTATWRSRSNQPTISSEPASRVLPKRQQNIVSPSVTAWIGLVRSTLSSSSSRPSGTSRRNQHERAHGGGEAGQNAQCFG